jgi:hypothetical protein
MPCSTDSPLLGGRGSPLEYLTGEAFCDDWGKSIFYNFVLKKFIYYNIVFFPGAFLPHIKHNSMNLRMIFVCPIMACTLL